MKTIQLTLIEFLNFKKIYKGKFQSTNIDKGNITIFADEKQLEYLGY